MADSLKFICPDCGGTKLEEVLTCTTTKTSPITAIKIVENECFLDYNQDEVSYEDGGDDEATVNYYGCADCGAEILNETGAPIDDALSLMNWLQEQDYNQNPPSC